MRADARARQVDTRQKDKWGPVFKGHRLQWQESLVADTTLSGASTTLTNATPALRLILGVFLHVLETITSAAGTDFDIGDGTTVNLWGDAIAFDAQTETDFDDFLNTGAGINVFNAAAGDVVLTCNGGTFSGGRVRVGVAYLDASANIRRP